MNFLYKSIFSIFAKFFGALLALLTSIILARLLGPSGVGQYQLIISTNTVIVAIMAMGFGNASIYFINQKKIEKHIVTTNLFKFFSLVSLLLFFIIFLLLKFFNSYFGKLEIISILIVSFSSSALLIYSVLLPTLYSTLQVVKIQIVSLFSSIIIIIGFGICFLLNYSNVDLFLIIASLSTIFGTLLLIFFIKDDLSFKIKLHYALLKDLFFYGIKLSATNLAFLLSINIVTFMLKIFQDEGFRAVGLFSRATAISNIFIMIPTTLGPLLYSKWSSVDEINIHFTVERTLRILLIVSILISFFIYTFGDNLLLLFYGKEFLDARNSLSILAISLIFSSISMVFTNMFSSIGKPTITLYSYTISLLITGLGSVILIPTFSIEGAAISILLGLIYNSLHLFYAGNKIVGIKLSNSLLISKKDIIYLWKSIIKK